jgi:hypothetical protein
MLLLSKQYLLHFPETRSRMIITVNHGDILQFFLCKNVPVFIQKIDDYPIFRTFNLINKYNI